MKLVKRLCAVAIFTLIVICAGSSVKAEEIVGNPTVKVDYVYVDSENVEHIIKEGCGVMIGTRDGGCTNVITNLDLVQLTKDEKKQLRKDYKISKDDIDKITLNINIALNSANLVIPASVANVSAELNMAILNLSQTIYDASYAVFDLDGDALTVGQDIYCYDMNNQIETGKLINVIEYNGVTYIEHDILPNPGNYGACVVNGNHEFLGLYQTTVYGGGFNALSGKAIAAIFSTLGVTYEAADHNDYSIKTGALESAIDVLEAMDLSDYTKDSRAAMTEALVEAKNVLADPQHTQQTIDVACELLQQAQGGLVKRKISVQTIILLVALGVVALVVIGLIIYIRVDKKKRRKKEQEAEEIEKKRAPKTHDPFKPDMINVNSYIAGGTLEGFAPSSKEIVINDEDTTVLQDDANGIELINEEKQYQIPINNFPYIIGKSGEQANYAIANGMISRKHIAIYYSGGKHEVADLNSKNGTYLNGTKLVPETGYEIHSGDELILANEVLKVK